MKYREPRPGRTLNQKNPEADASKQPAQVEQEWQPPELSDRKLDKTRDLPHAREFEHEREPDGAAGSQ